MATVGVKPNAVLGSPGQTVVQAAAQGEVSGADLMKKLVSMEENSKARFDGIETKVKEMEKENDKSKEALWQAINGMKVRLDNGDPGLTHNSRCVGLFLNSNFVNIGGEAGGKARRPKKRDRDNESDEIEEKIVETAEYIQQQFHDTEWLKDLAKQVLKLFDYRLSRGQLGLKISTAARTKKSGEKCDAGTLGSYLS